MELSERSQRAYNEYGFAHISAGEELRALLAPLHAGIGRAVALVASQHGIDVKGMSFDEGFETLCAHHRGLGSQVYDVVRQLPAFARLASSDAITSLASAALGTDDIAIAHAGSGVRIDRPGEQEFAADWHQEFPAQRRAKRGVTLWIPLVPVDATMGPVEICPGTQVAGVLPTRQRQDRPGAYGIEIENLDEVLRGQLRIAPPSEVGDVLLLDYLTVHRSGVNRSNRARWSVQVRYFSMACPWGIRHGWSKEADAPVVPLAASSAVQPVTPEPVRLRRPYVAPAVVLGTFEPNTVPRDPDEHPAFEQTASAA